MTKFVYKTWAGNNAQIEAHRIQFEPGHVVFRDEANRIILAESNSNVNHLVQVPEEE